MIIKNKLYITLNEKSAINVFNAGGTLFFFKSGKDRLKEKLTKIKRYEDFNSDAIPYYFY